MALIKSISGIRGTIGGRPGDALTPLDLVKFTACYVGQLRTQSPGQRVKIVLGRDARLSGELVNDIVEGTLLACGADVVALGLATTPTVEMAVAHYRANGGIILTASHNPKQWNALKLLNADGEFLSAADGQQILAAADRGDYAFAEIDDIGHVTRETFEHQHITAVMALPLVDTDAIRKAGFKVVVDAVNSVGGTAIPALLEALGVETVRLYCDPTGHFPHNPEPLPEHLTELSAAVVREKADLGIAVDPDVDRLALVCENGDMFGEEYTLVACADYVLAHTPGNTVSNLSSSRALRDITLKHGGSYAAAAVGEVNVVAKMKETGAVIGGEGNGGVIYPALHSGRDALVGVALFLSLLARNGKKTSELRASYPAYFMSKKRIDLPAGTDTDAILAEMKARYAAGGATEGQMTDIDGVKIDFPAEWVHLRKSNTEPIIRVYSESGSQAAADTLAGRFVQEIEEIIK